MIVYMKTQEESYVRKPFTAGGCMLYAVLHIIPIRSQIQKEGALGSWHFLAYIQSI